MKDSMGMIEIIFRMKFTSWHVQCFNSLKKKSEDLLKAGWIESERGFIILLSFLYL